MELISIIVPVYKVEPYLDKCVSSIVDQTYKNLEIILVDDGSPDNCPAMCDEWTKKDSRIKVIHKQNGGLSDARNAGMSIATGEFIGFVDSDDLIDKGFTEQLYNALKETGADISACDFREFHDDTEVSVSVNKTAQVEVSTCEEAIEDIQHNRRFRAVVWNKLYTRKILSGESFETGRKHEDEFFTYRLYDKASGLAYIDVPLYSYRQRPGSIMTSFSPEYLDILDAYLERIALLRKKYPRLVPTDKLNFCMACMNLYSEVSNIDADSQREAKKHIRNCRRKIRFSRDEFRKYSLKEKLYVTLSDSRIIEITCRLRKRRKGAENG